MCSREVPGADVLPTGLVSVCVCACICTSGWYYDFKQAKGPSLSLCTL